MQILTKVQHVMLAGLVLVGFSYTLKAQPTNFNTSRNWALHKKEVYFGLGATQFLGDVGGGKGEGRQKTFLDLNFPATRIGGHVGFRYRFHPMFATKTHLNIGMVSGDDALSKDEIRFNRNLHFRSIIIELSQQLEFILWSNEQVGRRYRVPGLKGFKNKASQIYLFGGIGIFYYNPQARYNGSWTSLRPLGTEGQNFDDGAKKYGPVSVSIPMGLGFKVGIGRTWKLGMEFAYHMTFTDYIDDVSTVYYNEAALAAQDPVAASLANPTLRPDWFNSNSGSNQRGNSKDRDALFFVNVTLIKNITYSNRTVGKTSVRWRSVKAKF
ncbi:hypothetical protein GCM10009118_00740 [Wandonia haliotis]|uniref:DUF6089 domain-containing protein n=1 Tax=Wandonia haliotis TaxID=574963 RepID=A0ABN1MK86_9FLAO